VIFVLVCSGIIETYFIYRETVMSLVHAQEEKATAEAVLIQQHILDLQRSISWATRASSATIELRLADYEQLLRTSPSIAEVVLLDGTGHEALRVSRDARTLGSNADKSQSPAYLGTRSGQSWLGPAFFENGIPFMLIALPHGGRKGEVMVAKVDLRFLADPISKIQAGPEAVTLLVSKDGRLIARSTLPAGRNNSSTPEVGQDLSILPQVSAIGTPGPELHHVGRDLQGSAVLFTSVDIPSLRATLFIEQPRQIAFHPAYELLLRLVTLFILGVVLSIIAGAMLARRMTVPIQALKAGAARLGSGDFSHKIKVQTGDEIEVLADAFNSMGSQLQESYLALERKVDERTRDLAQTVSELRALEEIGRAVASSLDLQRVLATIVTRAVELADAEGGAIFAFDESRRRFELAEAHNLGATFTEAVRRTPIGEPGTPINEAAQRREPIAVLDVAELNDFPLRDATVAAGFRSLLVVPLVGVEGVLGALVVLRYASGGFSKKTAELMQIFADQSVLAMHNARLFRKVEDKGRQLAIASEHKSQFFANMSHELRTPLNAVLGYTELLTDGLYGEIPDRAKQVLERVQVNGVHLLGLINDVLDLSKIEAGELTLTVEDYSMRNLVDIVVASTSSLAQAKGLALVTDIPDDLPQGIGDARRLTQVLLNIVGNAIKFTEKGTISICISASEGSFEIKVRDSGPGIALDDRIRIFDAFQQVDNSSTRQKGGTGLGLSISKRLVGMHGGTIEVESELGMGSTFCIRLPIEVIEKREAA
jgi:signal transduction histidine kinase